VVKINTILLYNGRKIRLNLAYDIVLKIFEMAKEKDLDDMDKIDIAISLFLKKRDAKRYKIEQKAEIIQRIFDEFIYTGKKTSKKSKKTFDFRQDWEYIYSSFMMDYQIDLYEQEGKLDWRKFNALFQGLSDKTKIAEIISIRAREIPVSDKYNAKEISALKEMKAYYKLEDEGDFNNYEQGIAEFGAVLQSRAR
jgi:hypothetical protein